MFKRVNPPKPSPKDAKFYLDRDKKNDFYLYNNMITEEEYLALSEYRGEIKKGYLVLNKPEKPRDYYRLYPGRAEQIRIDKLLGL